MAIVEPTPDPTVNVSFKAGNSMGDVLTMSVAPSPSFPPEAKPHPQTVPSGLIAYETRLPATIRTMFERPGTCTGVGCGSNSRVPIPNSPTVFQPQVQTVPSDLSAMT